MRKKSARGQAVFDPFEMNAGGTFISEVLDLVWFLNDYVVVGGKFLRRVCLHSDCFYFGCTHTQNNFWNHSIGFLREHSVGFHLWDMVSFSQHSAGAIQQRTFLPPLTCGMKSGDMTRIFLSEKTFTGATLYMMRSKCRSSSPQSRLTSCDIL